MLVRHRLGGWLSPAEGTIRQIESTLRNGSVVRHSRGRTSANGGFPVLHHYTDAFGAHGIISSHCLWATATQFSNDLSEIEYAVSVAVEVIKEVWGSKKNLNPWEET